MEIMFSNPKQTKNLKIYTKSDDIEYLFKYFQMFSTYIFIFILPYQYTIYITKTPQPINKKFLKRMQLLTKMNTKMDQGYKLTNFYCTYCNGVTLTNPSNNTGQVYCPKCDKQYLPAHGQLQTDDMDGNGNYNNDDINKNKSKNIQMKDTLKIGTTANNNNNKKQTQSTLSKTKKQQQSKQQEVTQKQNKQSNNNNNNKHNDSKYEELDDEDNSKQQQEEDDQVQRQYKEFLQTYNNLTKTAEQTKSQETSKKIGQKLINGWAMLEQSCSDCNVPLMRSRQGNLVCCGCDRDYAVKKEEKKEQAQEGKEKEGKKGDTSRMVEKADNNIAYGSSSSQPKHQQPSSHPHQTAQPIQSKQIPTSSATSSVTKHQSPNQTHVSPSSAQISARISSIASRSLNFLQFKLEQAIQMNDIQAVDRVIRSIKNVKELIN